MDERIAILGLGVVALVAVFGPKLDQAAGTWENASFGEQALRSASEYAGANRLSIQGSNEAQISTPGEEILSRSTNGHFYVDAGVDNRPVRFLVDTGASVVALTADDARKAGIGWDRSQLRHIGSGASGPVNGIPVRLSKVSVGAITATNVEAVVIPEGLDVSLLGQSFLSEVDSVTIKGDKMVLKAGD